MTLYEVNKMAYKSMSSAIDVKKARELVRDYLVAHPSKYYLMLCNEKRYYTIYTFKDKMLYQNMADEIVDIAGNLGDIKDIISNDNGALEFWINYENEPTMFVLFNYAQGVVEI